MSFSSISICPAKRLRMFNGNKAQQKLKQLPVIVFSTSFEQEVVNQLYKNGAQYFIRKPSEFSQFKILFYYHLHL